MLILINKLVRDFKTESFKMKYQITYEKKPTSEDTQILNDGIMEQAKQKKGMKQLDFFAFFIRDENEKIVGGCGGDNMYGGLYVGQLWVTQSLRSQGYGTQLMQKAEDLAKESKCNFIAVNTFDWEALDFYKKLGFYVEFERKGFDKNSVFYFLRKDLV
jgi:ribosomal protein S18 acetylase RimI-like enzyme